MPPLVAHSPSGPRPSGLVAPSALTAPRLKLESTALSPRRARGGKGVAFASLDGGDSEELGFPGQAQSRWGPTVTGFLIRLRMACLYVGHTGLAATAVGVVAAPVVLWSEWTLYSTGCGLPAGPGGALGGAWTRSTPADRWTRLLDATRDSRVDPHDMRRVLTLLFALARRDCSPGGHLVPGRGGHRRLVRLH